MEKCPKCGWFHTNECVPKSPVMGDAQTKAHNPPKTRTPILISAMRLLARDIQSDDGVANAAIAEAADRLEWFQEGLSKIALASDDHICERDLQDIAVDLLDPPFPTALVTIQDQLDGANAAILDLTDQLLKANARIDVLEAECAGKGRLIDAQKRLRESLQDRVNTLEASGTELLDAYRADVDAGLKHIFGIPPGPDPAFAAERLARAVDALAVLLNR